jgi:hypothetical protein
MTSTNRFASWILRAMDSSFAWRWLGRYRPSSRLRGIPVRHALAVVLVTSGPFLLVGWIALQVHRDWVQALAVLGVVLALALNVVLQCLGVMCWNWRAARLRGV